MSRSNLSARRSAIKAPADTTVSGAAGFALIEVLVAFTIALLALGMLYRTSSTGLAVGTTAARYSRALLIAEAALDEVGVDAPLRPGSSAQRVQGAYHEDVSVHPRPDLLPGPGAIAGAYPYEVSVDVSWQDAGRVRSIKLSTIRLGPLP